MGHHSENLILIQDLPECRSQIPGVNGLFNVLSHTEALRHLRGHPMTETGTDDHRRIRLNCRDLSGHSRHGMSVILNLNGQFDTAKMIRLKALFAEPGGISNI